MKSDTNEQIKAKLLLNSFYGMSGNYNEAKYKKLIYLGELYGVYDYNDTDCRYKRKLRNKNES